MSALAQQLEFTPFVQTESLSPEKQTVACTDLLVPGIGELIGGSEREDDTERLKYFLLSLLHSFNNLAELV